MATPRSGRRRPATTPPAAPVDVGRVAAIRDELDARSAGQRQREDALIADYLTTVKQNADIVARRDAAVGDLKRQLRTLADNAKEELATTEKRRAAVLAELNKYRSAEKLAIWFDLTPKKVRNLIRAHRTPQMPTTPTVTALEKADETTLSGAATTTPPRRLPAAARNSTLPAERLTETPSSAAAAPGPAGPPAAVRTDRPAERSVDSSDEDAPDGPERLF